MLTKGSKQLISFIAAMLWGLFIFYLSSIPNLQSGLDSSYDFILRKMAHIFVFAVLTYLIIHSLDEKRKWHIYFAIFVAIAYAFIDEFHQTGVAHRSGSPRDILIDSFGVYIGAFVHRYDLLNKLIKKFKK